MILESSGFASSPHGVGAFSDGHEWWLLRPQSMTVPHQGDRLHPCWPLKPHHSDQGADHSGHQGVPKTRVVLTQPVSYSTRKSPKIWQTTLKNALLMAPWKVTSPGHPKWLLELVLFFLMVQPHFLCHPSSLPPLQLPSWKPLLILLLLRYRAFGFSRTLLGPQFSPRCKFPVHGVAPDSSTHEHLRVNKKPRAP